VTYNSITFYAEHPDVAPEYLYRNFAALRRIFSRLEQGVITNGRAAIVLANEQEQKDLLQLNASLAEALK
jgi:hypothetical protein